MAERVARFATATCEINLFVLQITACRIRLLLLLIRTLKARTWPKRASNNGCAALLVTATVIYLTTPNLAEKWNHNDAR